MLALVALLLALAAIDNQCQLLPDCLTLSLLWIGLLWHCLAHPAFLPAAVIGAMAGYLALWLLYWGFRLATGREGLGYGDFKLLAALGAWGGYAALPSILLVRLRRQPAVAVAARVARRRCGPTPALRAGAGDGGRRRGGLSVACAADRGLTQLG